MSKTQFKLNSKIIQNILIDKARAAGKKKVVIDVPTSHFDDWFREFFQSWSNWKVSCRNFNGGFYRITLKPKSCWYAYKQSKGERIVVATFDKFSAACNETRDKEDIYLQYSSTPVVCPDRPKP